MLLVITTEGYKMLSSVVGQRRAKGGE